MKKLLFVIILVLLPLSFPFAQDKSEKKSSKESSAKVDTTKIIWHPYDVGLKLAKESGKHIVVNFTAKWCGYCKKMEKETFSMPEVIKFLNTNFVCIKVDGDSKNELNVSGYKITEQNLARNEYRVTGYPTFWFLKSTSERIGPVTGYQPTDRYLDMLYFVKDDIYQKMTFNDYITKGGRKVNN